VTSLIPPTFQTHHHDRDSNPQPVDKGQAVYPRDHGTLPDHE